MTKSGNADASVRALLRVRKNRKTELYRAIGELGDEFRRAAMKLIDEAKVLRTRGPKLRKKRAEALASLRKQLDEMKERCATFGEKDERDAMIMLLFCEGGSDATALRKEAAAFLTLYGSSEATAFVGCAFPGYCAAFR